MMTVSLSTESQLTESQLQNLRWHEFGHFLLLLGMESFLCFTKIQSLRIFVGILTVRILLLGILLLGVLSLWIWLLGILSL